LRGTVERPEGLVYQEDFLDESEEAGLLRFLEGLDYHDVTMRGQTAKRTVRHYGFDYGYESWQLTPAEPLPEELSGLRARAAALVGVEPEELAEILVSRYPAGAGIGWHRDAPMFGPAIVGVSLGAPAPLRFQRGKGPERRVFELEVAPRSAYVLSGAARSTWQHSIPAAKGLRYSITFRTLRNPDRWAAEAR
jgi:alkylated DNA repair dioxygenase AlkB